MKKVLSFFTAVFLLSASNSYAQLFDITVTRDLTSDSVSASFHSIEDAIDYFDSDNLSEQFGSNVNAEPISANLNFRGLPASLSYAGTNLVLQIDDVVTKTFTGTSRDDVLDQMEEYFKSGGGDDISRIQRRLAKVSPVDPIAGNPISLMSQMVENDFELTYVESMYDSPDADSERNEMGIGAKYSQYDVSGLKSKVLSVSPFTWRNNFGDSNAKFLIKLPVLAAIDTEGAKTYQLSGALGFHIPLVDKVWSIAPLASLGAVGSADLGAATAIRGVSLTNKLRFDIGDWGLHLGTLFGNYVTEKVSINGYKSDPDIKNNILKNSVGIRAPLDTMQNYALEFNVANTRFYGTDLYIENAMDYGVAFIKTSNQSNNEARFDVKYFTYDAERSASIGNGKKGVKGILASLKFQY